MRTAWLSMAIVLARLVVLCPPPRRLLGVARRPGRRVRDQAVQPLVDAGEDLRALVGRELVVLDGLVELRCDRGPHRGLEVRGGLALVLREIDQRLAGAQLRAQLVVAEAEELRGRAERHPGAEAESGPAGRAMAVSEAGASTAAQPARRQPATGRDPLLGFVALLLGQPPGGDRRVDAVARRALERRVELVARDIQALGEVVEERLLLSRAVRRRRGRGLLRRRIRPTGSRVHGESGSARGDLALGTGHVAIQPPGPE